ncbi:glycolipid transfer protein domain-containing protein [Mycotypha africana]|uniref:glycolipid transfer protein domain-containing protein n=1 Tax=Mycotypha africana TaxID=64632 RepID=UPI0023002CA9|nr:glycolipid transfer protein domain-containing protein [Mycotypha africana]KAI8987583.1 glycolipid transfer protein domain-containing protein [Mycotypha africana]
MTTTELPAFQKIITRSFIDVEVIDEGINTDQFLEATDGLIKMFDLFGSAAFSVVQNDMRNNVKKIRTRFMENPVEYDTLEKLMAKEAHLKKRTATEALLWLKRGLEFTSQSLLHSLQNPNDELKTSFSQAYEKTLKPHHNFLLAMNACPWRKDFYERIDVTTEENTKMMKEWLDALQHLIDILNHVFKKNPAYTKH